MDKKFLNVKEVALFGMLGALTFGGKFVMSSLPNIEPVSLFVLVFTVVFGLKSLFPIGIYVALEILVYGIQLWNINYLYVWAILAIIAFFMRRVREPLIWAVTSGLFGLCFGALCAPVYLFTGGFSFALSWWLSGIPFDLLHCAGNFFMALVLFMPLRKLLDRLYHRYILQ